MVKPVADYRRQEILDATLKALDEHGLSRLSYDHIADQASTSRQLIRHYYPDLEPLMVDVVKTLTSRFRTIAIQRFADNADQNRLQILFDFFLGPLQNSQSPSSTAFDAMFALANNSTEIKRALETTHTLLCESCTNEVQTTYPNLRQSAAAEIGHVFASLVIGHWRMVSSLDMSEGYTKVTRQAMDRLVDSYLSDVGSDQQTTLDN